MVGRDLSTRKVASTTVWIKGCFRGLRLSKEAMQSDSIYGKHIAAIFDAREMKDRADQLSLGRKGKRHLNSGSLKFSPEITIQE